MLYCIRFFNIRIISIPQVSKWKRYGKYWARFLAGCFWYKKHFSPSNSYILAQSVCRVFQRKQNLIQIIKIPNLSLSGLLKMGDEWLQLPLITTALATTAYPKDLEKTWCRIVLKTFFPYSQPFIVFTNACQMTTWWIGKRLSEEMVFGWIGEENEEGKVRFGGWVQGGRKGNRGRKRIE